MTLRRAGKWLGIAVAVVLVLAVGGPFAYTQWLNRSAAKPLTFADLPSEPTTTTRAAHDRDGRALTAFEDTPASRPAAGAAARPAAPRAAAPTNPAVTPGAAATSPIAGSWTVGKGSQGGYSVDDNVMGQTTRVVGRTSDVSGAMTILGSTVTAARVVVNMQTVRCNCVHDTKYRDLMETGKYPTSRFELAEPISIAAIPAPGVVITVPVTGRFTIHGVTRTERFVLKATRTGARVAINASIPVKLADYNVSNQRSRFGSLSNADIDLLIAFDRAA